jgi:hypothetical protein
VALEHPRAFKLIDKALRRIWQYRQAQRLGSPWHRSAAARSLYAARLSSTKLRERPSWQRPALRRFTHATVPSKLRL